VSVARRASRAAFAASAAVACYTSAAFGAALFAGLGPAESCIVAAVTGFVLALAASRVVRRHEERESRRRIVRAQLESAQARESEPPVAPPPAATAEPETREHRESREIQTALLPARLPTIRGYHLEVAYEPCGALGGDFYDIHELDGRILLTIGDVSGKGPSGAIVMAMVQTLVRAHLRDAHGPADLLRRVNDGFAGTLGRGIFVTALVGLLDPRAHRLMLAGAGHHPVLLLNPGERRTTRVAARGLALGLAAGKDFDDSLVETTIDVAPGDALLLYTDGATEGVDEIAKGVGENRFLAAAAASVLSGPVGALDRLRSELADGAPRQDDTTLLLLARTYGTNGPTVNADRTSRTTRV